VPDFNNKQHVYALQNYLIEQGMLTEDVDYAIKTLLGEAPDKPTNPKIAQQAKKMGLVWKRNGYGPKDKKGITYKVDNDKLVPVDDKKDDDKDDKEKEKEEPKANVVSQDAVADRGKNQNTDVNPDYQRDVGEPEKDIENQEKLQTKKNIKKKIENQTKNLKKQGLDKDGISTKTPKNPNLDLSVTSRGVVKVHDGLDNVNDSVQESTVIPDKDKKNITSAIQKCKDEKVDEMSDDEIGAMRRWIAVKDQSGQPDENKRSAEFYIADVKARDFRFGPTKVSDDEPAKQARKKVTMVGGKGKKPYDEIQKFREAIGLKSASPKNSRTSSTAMAPTTTNPKRKKVEIKVEKRDESGKVTEVTIGGQKLVKRSVPKKRDVEKKLMGPPQNMSVEDAKRKARSAVLGIQRYNDQIDSLAEVEGDLESVDYGDLTTNEGRQAAISQCLEDVSKGLQKALERTVPPHPPLTEEHYELVEYIKNIENPLDDPDWESLPFEEKQKRSKLFNEEMGIILVKMNELDDMKTSRAEVAESITFMHRASQGFNCILPASATFQVTDIWALKDPGDTEDPQKVAESIQQILVSVEVSGGESVKYDQGARSSSSAKVKQTVYKNKKTRSSIHSLLDTYDKIYNGDTYPPTQEALGELDEVRDAVKKQTVSDGIMTEEQYDEIYEDGMKTGEKAFESFLKKSGNAAKLRKAGFTEPELALVKESFKKHCAHGNTMAAINNKDTEYNKFSNVSHKIVGQKQDKDTKEIIRGSGKYKTQEMDGINTISGMNFSCDQGFNIAKPPKKKISPENTNPSAITAIDPKTGNKIK
jgi:hypothetical protein